VTTAGLIFSVAGFVALTAGGWLGGSIVSVHGIRVLAREDATREQADGAAAGEESPSGLAATGLVLWIVYVATSSSALAWIAFVILLAVAVIGFTMLAIWMGQRRRRTEAAAAAPGAAAPAEQTFPDAVVGLHGVLAAVTLVLVLISAIAS
jgi:hypothetical protein